MRILNDLPFRICIYTPTRIKQSQNDICSPVSIKKTETLFNIKGKDTLSFVTTCMDMEGVMLHEIKHVQKDKWYVISLMCESKIAKLIEAESKIAFGH
jgi:hypothetical protein